jgi:uncharacterized protein DUF6518
VALVTPLAAVALGGLDLLLQKILPYPWANLANSSAVWAIAAWALGRWVGTPRWLAAAAGATLLVLAVPSYYLAATIFLNDDLTMIGQPAALLWMAFGLLAGVVFGFGGSLALSAGWQRIVGIALPGAVLFAEALARVAARNDADQRQTAIIEAALGVIIVMALGRTLRGRLLAILATVPWALVGFVAFWVGGFR